MAEDWVALSVKQPWAALLALGMKRIEVRTWKTHRRGRVLIHAAKVPDLRPEAWRWVTTPPVEQLAQLRGGIIGLGELEECRCYATSDNFRQDQGLHLNAPEWFREPALDGFVFSQLQVVPFHPFAGNTFFFRVPGFDLKAPPPVTP